MTIEEQIIKSKHRVQKHGEVFTPSWMVQKMLDTPGVKEACDNPTATFLEPSAGDGNFLTAILERKLTAITQHYDARNWKTKSLLALSSIYGIEFLADNLEVARSRMFLTYLDWYEQHLGEHLTSKSDLYRSAHYLIHKNIVRGNTLTKRHPETDKFIVLNEWKQNPNHPSLIQKVPFVFAELFGEEVDKDNTVVEGQMSLFDWEDEEENSSEASPFVPIQKVYTLGE